MREDLDGLLAADDFIGVPVEFPELLLLSEIERLGLLGRIDDVGEHQDVERQHDERELPAQNEDHRQHPDDLRRVLDEGREGVVERVADRVDVVREFRHDVPVGMRVKERNRQVLHVVEHVPPHLVGDVLREDGEHLHVDEGAECPDRVEDPDGRYDPVEPVDIRVLLRHEVDDRLDGVRSVDRRQRRHQDEDGNQDDAENMFF